MFEHDNYEAVQVGEAEGGWRATVGRAHVARVGLSVVAHYNTPEQFTKYSLEERKGNRWAYFTTGACCTIAEVKQCSGYFSSTILTPL